MDYVPIEETERVARLDEAFISDDKHWDFNPITGIWNPYLIYSPTIWFEPFKN